MGLRSGVPSGFSAVRRFRVSTVRSSRVPVVRRFGYWGTFGRVRDRLRVPPRDSRDGVVSVESISRAECRRVRDRYERHMVDGERASFISHFEYILSALSV